MRSPLLLSFLVLSLAACEVDVHSGRGARNPPPNGNGGRTTYQGGSSAPPAYGNGGTTTTTGGGTTAPPAYGNGGTNTGNGTTAPPAYGNGGTNTGTGTTAPPATAATPTYPPPATGGGVTVVGSGVGIPFGPGGTAAGGRMQLIQVIAPPPPPGSGTRGTDMASPIGRLPLVSGDVDFGTNVQWQDSFKGMIYLLPPGTTSMPNYDAMRPQLALYTRTFEVEPQNFRGLGAPGASLRTKDFGIRYDGFFTAKTSGSYQITVANEDGAKLYIDGRLVIDNDGVHQVTFKTVNVDITSGTHNVRVDYFKSAANPEVALEIWVHSPGMVGSGVTMFNPAL